MIYAIDFNGTIVENEFPAGMACFSMFLNFWRSIKYEHG